MTPGPRTLHAAAKSRLLAALCISALVHLSAPVFVNGGASRSPRVRQPPPVLAVRVMPEQRAPQAEPLLQRLETPQEPRQKPKTPPRAEPPPIGRAAPIAPLPETERSASALPEAPDLTYYAARQLDVYPKLLAPLDLAYRGKAADDGVSGRVLLLVLIDEAGAVKEVSVVEAEPPSYFEDEAMRALTRARFMPAYRSGRAVRSRMQIEVNYGVERGSP